MSVKVASILRFALVLNLLWLTSCATQPRQVAADCLAVGEPSVVGQFALEMTQNQSSHELLVVTQWREGQLTFAGFNPVGAKLFTGEVIRGQITAENSRLYRGPAAEDVLWGLLLHQLRDQLPECWPSRSVQSELQMMSMGAVRVFQDGKLVFTGAENGFTLPRQNIRVQVRPLGTS